MEYSRQEAGNRQIDMERRVLETGQGAKGNKKG